MHNEICYGCVDCKIVFSERLVKLIHLDESVNFKLKGFFGFGKQSCAIGVDEKRFCGDWFFNVVNIDEE